MSTPEPKKYAFHVGEEDSEGPDELPLFESNLAKLQRLGPKAIAMKFADLGVWF